MKRIKGTRLFRSLVIWSLVPLMAGGCNFTITGKKEDNPGNGNGTGNAGGKEEKITLSSVSPGLISNSLTPRLTGSAPSGSATVGLYSDSDCSTLLGSASAADFSATGITVTVAANTSTSIYAVETDSKGKRGSCTLLAEYLHDNVPPAVSIGAPSLTLISGSGSVYYDVSYAGAAVVTLSAGDVSLDISGTANCLGKSVTIQSSSVRRVTLSSCSGEGTVGISIPTGTAQDLAGNPAMSAGPSATFGVAALVITAPKVLAVSAQESDQYLTHGEVVNISVQFDQSVHVTGTPTLTLETGPTDRVASYVSGSGSNTLVFKYTMQVGDVSSDLDYAAADSLALGGGTIRSGGGTNAVLALPAPGAAGSLGANKAFRLAPFDSGEGTADDPFIIANPTQLSAIGSDANYNTRHFLLNADLDVTGLTVTALKNDIHFSGTFDGGGHKINGLTTNYWIPIISTGVVKNLGLTNVNINNPSSDYQCPIGVSTGTIDRVYVTGSVTGKVIVGGLGCWQNEGGVTTNSWTDVTVTATGTGDVYAGGIFAAFNGGSISRVYSLGSQAANDATANYVGGIAGQMINSAALSDCYTQATSIRSGHWYVGGIAGRNGGTSTIARCYVASPSITAGNVTYRGAITGYGGGTSISATYWDGTISGINNMCGSVNGMANCGQSATYRKTTVELKAEATYTGWDFTNVWQIIEGVSYPTLRNMPGP